MHVLSDNDGFALITKNTLVFLPFAPWIIILKHVDNMTLSPLVIASDLSKVEAHLLGQKE